MKYNFSLPGPELRKAFAMKWIHKIESIGATAAVGYGIVFEEKFEDVAEKVSQRTEGWSFAFLKELCVASLYLRIYEVLTVLDSCHSYSGLLTTTLSESSNQSLE